MEEDEKLENPNAFPVHPNINSDRDVGMTLRDYFAAKVMQSLIVASGKQTFSLINRIKIFFGINGWTTNYYVSPCQVSKSSYEIADEMLKQREL